MGKNTSISIGRYFEDFIQKQVLSGRFASVSEVVRAGLRLLEEEEEKREALRQALIAGEKSGPSVTLDNEAFKTRMTKAVTGKNA